MKPIFRIALASLSGLAAGWIIQQFRAAEPAPASVLPVVKTSPVFPGKNPGAEWRRWLGQCSSIQPLADADAFWSRMPQAGAGSQIERELALEEALFNLPPDIFLAILADERFSDFPRLYEVGDKTLWSRKLLSIGLEEALGMAGKMPTAWLNAHLENVLMDALAKQDPVRGYEWLKKSDGGDQRNITDYLEQVAKHDVDQAAGMFAKLDASMRWHGAANILKALGSKDWRKAEAWGKENLTPAEWRTQAEDIFMGYSGPRLAELRKIGDQITDPVLRSAAYSRSVFWPVASCSETLDRALALPAGSLTDEGWKTVAFTCSFGNRRDPDPVAGAQELRLLFGRVPEEARAAFQDNVIRHVSLNDGPFAVQFFETMPKETVTELANRWTGKDPAAVSAWLSTLPPSDKKEAAVLAFSREATPVDPAGAAAWASTLKDPGQRESAVHSALAAWRQREPAAAESWAESKGLPTAR